MELQMQMMMDPSSGTLNGGATMWLGHSPDSSPQPPAPPPPYHRHLSPNRQDERIIVSAQQLDDDESSMKLWLYQASMGFHESTCHGVLWHEKRDLPKHSVDGNLGQLRINNRDESLSTKHSAASFHQSSTTNGLKRRAVCESHQQMPELLDRKHARRDGSVGSNGSVGHAGWSTQVEELAEHLAADFDGPLSALAASDLANAVASYNMSEALLALPSLTVFKQEAPSPDNQTSNSNLNHVSQRNTSQNSNNGGVCTPGNEADSDNNNDTNRNNEQRGFNGVGAVPNLISSINGGSTATITPNINSSSRTSGVAAAAAATTVNQQNHRNKNHGSRNNEQTDGNNLHQLLCSNGDDYPPVNSSSGNPHVSSSQQGNEFNEDSRFQYVLAAATSIATKLNEETLTYLNQGQSYEIKLKKLGDLSAYRGKILKSNIRICFHERRLQYTEREQMLAWQRARPGERLLEVDVPLSYGMLDVSQLSASKNSIEFMWDPTKEVGVYIKVNCISTEFTPKKHGGEKGVPFRILVETRLPGGPRLHAASCQVKVFKLKGADRKHKQDRDKILRRPPHEQDKYQPSYDCTVLSDIPLDSLSSSSPINKKNEGNLFESTDTTSPHENHAAVIVDCGRGDDDNGDDGTSSSVAQAAIPLSLGGGSSVVSFINTLEREKERDDGCTNTAESSNVCATSSTATSTIVRASFASRLPAPVVTSLSNVAVAADSGDGVEATFELSANANVAQTNAWLRARRFQPFQNTFASFSAEDILRLSRDDLIQICGLADGIRLFNALHSKAPTPKLTLYFAMEGNSAVPWRVIYMENLNSTLFTSKLLTTLNLPHDRLQSILIQGPHGVHVLVSNELVANIKNESMYLVEIIKDCSSERYKLLLKPSMLPQAPLSTTPSPPPPPQR